MDYIIRPLGPWIEPVTADRWSTYRFKARWSDTLDLLQREVGYLGADRVVFQIDVTEGDLRQDGMLRTHARVGFPGVRVSFDSIHGPLTYATDAYERLGGSGLTSWQANIRAIALALEALRAVDRYGVSRRGQQYRGWQAISAEAAVMTPDQAAEFLHHWANDSTLGKVDAILADRATRTRVYRAAARRAHPDQRGGDHDTMSRLNVAKDLLDALNKDRQ